MAHVAIVTPSRKRALAKSNDCVNYINMKKLYTPLSAIALTALLVSHTSAASAETSPAEICEAALSSDKIAMDIVEGLTTEIGPRQAGTEAEARARTWAVKKLGSLGFSNPRIEEYQMPTWVRGEETASVLSPYPQKLVITAIGNSGSTGETALEADIAYFPTLNDLMAVPDGSLKGKIAFVSHAMKRTQDGSSYGAFGKVRFGGPNVAAKKGAAAIMIRSVGTDYHRNPHTGMTSFDDGVKPIPAAALSIPDAENLERMIMRGKSVRIKLKLTPKNIGMQTSGNVIAELPGSDPSLGMIVVACHLDSWDLGTGALDDAAGCAIVTAAAKHASSKGTLKRTIRVLWAGAEEVGIWGGNAYGEMHKDDNHALAMESDFGAGRVWKIDFNLPETSSYLSDSISSTLAPLGIARGVEKAHGGADIGAIINNSNLAVIDLNQDGTEYFDIHHTPDDTLDKVNPDHLRQNVAAWATVLSIVGNNTDNLIMPEKK